MLNNLEKARQEENITLNQMADVLKVRYQTVRDKINGKYSFKFEEALLLQEKLFPNYELKYLFSKD